MTCARLQKLVKKLNQRGFATLETICVILIISLLTTTAVPQMARMIDSARLDYEMKTFLNNLELAKSLNRGTDYSPEIFAGNLPDSYKVAVDVKETFYNLRLNDTVLKTRKLPEGFSIRQKNLGENFGDSFFIDTGKSGRVIITSRLGNQRFIYHDGVGRWSGDYKERY